VGRIYNIADYAKVLKRMKEEHEAEVSKDLLELPEDEDVEVLTMGELSDIDEYLRNIEEGCSKLREVLDLDGETFDNGY
jgi:hypothetical protein